MDFSEIWTLFFTTAGTAAIIGAVAMVFFSLQWRHRLHETNKTAHKLLVAAVFGLLAIYGSFATVTVNGASCNCRDLPILYAGLVGGPIAGLGAAVIGALFRYFVQGVAMGGNLTLALNCSIACFIAGIIGSCAHLFIRKKHRYKVWVGVVLIAVSVSLHMLMSVAFGYGDVIKRVVIPMVLANCLGMAFCLYMYKRSAYKWNDPSDKLADTLETL